MMLVRVLVLAVGVLSLHAPTAEEGRPTQGSDTMTQVDRQALCRRWIHSHEEDAEGETVYRSSEFSFPPSRGRRGFELKADQTCVEIGIAPTDGPRETACTWELVELPKPSIVLKSQAGTRRVLEVVEIGDDRLVVKE